MLIAESLGNYSRTRILKIYKMQGVCHSFGRHSFHLGEVV